MCFCDFVNGFKPENDKAPGSDVSPSGVYTERVPGTFLSRERYREHVFHFRPLDRKVQEDSCHCLQKPIYLVVNNENRVFWKCGWRIKLLESILG